MSDLSTVFARPPVLSPGMPSPHPLDPIFAVSGRVFMDLREGQDVRLTPGLMAPVTAQAEAFLRRCSGNADALREAADLLSDDDIANALVRFVGAWPNTSNNDLAGFGAHLVEYVIKRQPCRYALDEALRFLVETSRFLPSIAEVLAALDKAQNRVRNTVWHIDQIRTLLGQSSPRAAP